MSHQTKLKEDDQLVEKRSVLMDFTCFLSGSLMLNVRDIKIGTYIAMLSIFLQISSYTTSIYNHKLADSGGSTINFTDNMFSFFQYLFVLVQPIRILSSFSSEITDWIIFSLIFIVLFTIPLVLINQFLKSKGNFLQKNFTLFCICQVLIWFNSWFCMPIMEILLSFIKYGCLSMAGECSHKNVIIQYFSYFLLLVVIIKSILIEMTAERTAKFNAMGLQKLFNFQTTTVLRFSRILLIILYVQYPTGDVQSIKIFMELHQILIIISMILECLFKMPFSSLEQSQFYLASGVSCLLYVFLDLLLVLDFIQESMLYYIVMVVSPICVRIVINIYQVSWNKIVFETLIEDDSVGHEDWNWLLHKVSFFYTSLEKFKVDFILNMKLIGYLKKHCMACQNPMCVCFKYQKKITFTENDDQMFTNHNFTLEIYTKQILSHINQDYFLNSEQNMVLYMKYLDFFIEQGKFSLVTGKIIFLQMDQNSRSNNKVGFYLRSQIFSMLQLSNNLLLQDFHGRVVNEKQLANLQIGSIYLIVEKKLKVKIAKFKRILNYKIEMMVNMIQGYETCSHLIQAIKSYYNIMFSFEQELKVFHEEASYIKSYNMLIYYYSNIMGDYRSAQKIVATKNYLTHVSNISHQNHVILAFSDEIVSITASIGKQYGTIISFSHKTPLFFGYTRNEFQIVKSIHDLMLPSMAEKHEQLVQDFILVGEAESVTKYILVASCNQQGYIIPVYLFIAFDFTFTNDLVYTAFLCHPDQCDFDPLYEGWIQTNVDGNIEGLSQSLFMIANCKDDYIIPKNLKVLSITNMMPVIDLDIEKMQQNPIQQLEQVDLFFPASKNTALSSNKFKSKYTTVQSNINTVQTPNNQDSNNPQSEQTQGLNGNTMGMTTAPFGKTQGLSKQTKSQKIDPEQLFIWIKMQCDLTIIYRERLLTTGEKLQYVLYKCTNIKDEEELRNNLKKESENKKESGSSEFLSQLNSNIDSEMIANNLMGGQNDKDPDMNPIEELDQEHQEDSSTKPKQDMDKSYVINDEHQEDTHFKEEYNDQQPLMDDKDNENLSPKKKIEIEMQKSSEKYSQQLKSQYMTGAQETQAQKGKIMRSEQVDNNNFEDDAENLKNRDGINSNGNDSEDKQDVNFQFGNNYEDGEGNKKDYQNDYRQKMEVIDEFFYSGKKMKKIQIIKLLMIVSFLLMLSSSIFLRVFLIQSFEYLMSRNDAIYSFSQIFVTFNIFITLKEGFDQTTVSFDNGRLTQSEFTQMDDFYRSIFLQELQFLKLQTSNDLKHEFVSKMYNEKFIQLKNPYAEIISEEELQEFTFRSACMFILNMSLQMIDMGLSNVDPTHYTIKFLEGNFIEFKKFYDELLEEVNIEANDYNESAQFFFNFLTFFSISFVICLFIACGTYYYLFMQEFKVFLLLMTDVPPQQADSEVMFLRSLVAQIEESDYYIIDFEFNSNDIGEEMKKRQQYSLSIDSQGKDQRTKSRSRISITKQQMSVWRFFVLIFLAILCYIIPTVIQYTDNIILFQDFPVMLAFFNQISQAQSNIQICDIERHIYGKKIQEEYSYYTQEEMNLFDKYFEESIEQSLRFRNQMNLAQQFVVFQDFDQSFNDKLFTESICNEELGVRAEDIQFCGIVKNKIATYGLLAMLDYIYLEFKQAFLTNHLFYYQSTGDDTAAIYILTNVIRQSIDKYYTYFQDWRSDSQTTAITVLIGQIILLFVMFISLVGIYFKSINDEFETCKRIVWLMPVETIVFEDQIVKKIKNICNRYNIMN